MRLYYYFSSSITEIKRRRSNARAGRARRAPTRDYRELFTCHKAQITSAARAVTSAILRESSRETRSKTIATGCRAWLNLKYWKFTAPTHRY